MIYYITAFLSRNMYFIGCLHCIYEYKINTKNKTGEPVTETYNTILQIGSSCAKFEDYTAFMSDSVSMIKDVSDATKKEYLNKKYRATYYFDHIIYQNYPESKTTVEGVITPNYFVYEEKLNPFQWSLSEDTATVCGYSCHKATTTYGGRNWTIWYTMDIPVSYGPWKFTGLPGLILAAKDSEGIHSFSAISIRKSELPIRREHNAKLIATSREKFIKAKNDFEKDPMRNIPVEAVESMDIVRYGDGANDKTALINGVQLRINPNGYTPLELK